MVAEVARLYGVKPSIVDELVKRYGLDVEEAVRNFQHVKNRYAPVSLWDDQRWSQFSRSTAR